MPAPLTTLRVPLGFPFWAGARGLTAAPGGPTAPPPPRGLTVASGPIVASGGPTARRTEVGGLTARPFAASSSRGSSTSTAPYALNFDCAPRGAHTPPAPCTTPASTTPPAPPAAPASQHYSCCPWAAREPPALPLLQESPAVKAIPVAPLVNPHLMITRVKRGFRLPTDKLTLSATSSPLSLVPTTVCATLADPS
jgi:hypothetical protein